MRHKFSVLEMRHIKMPQYGTSINTIMHANEKVVFSKFQRVSFSSSNSKKAAMFQSAALENLDAKAQLETQMKVGHWKMIPTISFYRAPRAYQEGGMLGWECYCECQTGDYRTLKMESAQTRYVSNLLRISLSLKKPQMWVKFQRFCSMQPLQAIYVHIAGFLYSRMWGLKTFFCLIPLKKLRPCVSVGERNA